MCPTAPTYTIILQYFIEPPHLGFIYTYYCSNYLMFILLNSITMRDIITMSLCCFIIYLHALGLNTHAEIQLPHIDKCPNGHV